MFSHITLWDGPVVFYLKVNRNEKYTYRNLQHWVEVIDTIPESRIIILCDNPEVKEMVLERVQFKEKAEFLTSGKDSETLREIVPLITNTTWENAGYAHLTTFLHAKENGYPCFWNIDGDDTCVCLSPERAAEMLKLVQRYAEENRIQAVSLDMWATRTGGRHWSFGVTFVDNTVDWFGIMRKYDLDEELKSSQIRNVDGFFSCLKQCSDLKLESFYAENLKFIHYSNDFFKRPDTSGFFHWRDGELILPFLLYCLGMESIGRIPIREETIKLDLQIQEEESRQFLLDYALPEEKQLLGMRG